MNKDTKARSLLKKKKFSNEDISFLTTLSKESLESLSESFTREQKEKIYEILSTPKVPSWINSTIKIHKSTPHLKTTLPKLSEKKDFRKVIEMIMISAGDFRSPNPQTVNLLYKNLKSFLRRISKLKKKTLYNKFPKINAKYGYTHQQALYIKQEEDEESCSENEGSRNIDMKNIERLQFNDLRTSQMTEEEYMRFTECRKVSFTKYGKEAFLTWSGANKNIRFLGWVARERVFEIVENSIRNRDHKGKLSIISTPLCPNELVFNE